MDYCNSPGSTHIHDTFAKVTRNALQLLVIEMHCQDSRNYND